MHANEAVNAEAKRLGLRPGTRLKLPGRFGGPSGGNWTYLGPENGAAKFESNQVAQFAWATVEDLADIMTAEGEA
jgi:hypothetical protein